MSRFLRVPFTPHVVYMTRHRFAFLSLFSRYRIGRFSDHREAFLRVHGFYYRRLEDMFAFAMGMPGEADTRDGMAAIVPAWRMGGKGC